MPKFMSRSRAGRWWPALAALTFMAAGLNVAAAHPASMAAAARVGSASLRTPSGAVAWPQTYHDGGHTNYNPSESLLSPSTVGALQLIGSVGVAGGPMAFVLDNDALFALGQGDGVHPNLIAVNARTGATVWSTTSIPFPASASMAAGQGLVFVECLLSPNSTPYEGVCAYDERDGNLVWSYGNQQQGGDDITSLTYANGVIYLGYGLVIGGISFQPGIAALNAATGQQLYLTNVGGTGSNALNGTTPVVGGGYVYYNCNLNNIQGVCAFSASTGQLAWQYNAGPSALAFTYIAGVLLVHANDSGACSIVALNGSTGRALSSYNYQQGCGSPYPVAVAYGTIFAANTSGTLFAVNRAGRQIWSVQGSFASAPAVANGVVYIQNSYADSATTAAYSAQSGALLWSANEIGQNLATPPVVANGVLIAAGTACGSICAYTLPHTHMRW